MNTEQAELLKKELLCEMKSIKNDLLNEFRKEINEFRFETESKFREISKINRRLKDIERDQRADAGIARAVQAQAMKFEPIPYEWEGNSFIEEIKDYY